MIEENMRFVMKPAFPPPATPKISSKAKSTLDFALCRDEYKLLIDKNKKLIRGELFTGTIALNPSLVEGARCGIEILDKRSLYIAESESFGRIMEQLSNYYSSFKGDSLVGVRLEDEEKLNRFLLTYEGARMLIEPSLTYNHLSVPDCNEIWVGGEIASYDMACDGAIAPNLEDFFNREARSFLWHI